MNTTQVADSIRDLGSLNKLDKVAAPVVLAAGLGLAVIGLGAATANAQPLEVNCPTAVAAGQPSTVTLAGWPEGGVITASLDSLNAGLDAGPPIHLKTFTVDHNLASSVGFYLPLPGLSAGRHDVEIQETKPQSNDIGSAEGCTLYVK